jgi:hypothetical protein
VNIAEFISKWSKAELKERSAAQEHFLDLCELVGHPKPAAADPTGASFCFEKGAAKLGGGDGFADVWKRLFFGWEYKGKHKNLDSAFDQLYLYRDAIENPPLLVVCDMDRIVIRTNFTGTAPATYDIPLEKLGEPRNLEILHHVFFDPEKLKPGTTSQAITQDAADRFAKIADSMRARGLDSGKVAHFLDRVVFCQFAEDIGLLPNMIFSRIVEKSAGDPGKFSRLIGQLFEAMAKGGEFGLETIRHFNGSLFNDNAVLELTAAEVKTITEAARLDWSAVDPSIFGTLFERGLDPAKRSQLGAHFTGKDDIELLVDAVVMTPLRREWQETRTTVENLLETGRKTGGPGKGFGVQGSGKNDPKFRKAMGEAGVLIHSFLSRLANVKVLDPACGSGNFLYVTLLKLKDLEKAVILYAMEKGLGGFLPMVGPWQLYGIEINPYAHDLAQMTVWIGWLQWIKFNGFGSPQEPILRQMTGNFQCRDAIIRVQDPGTGVQADVETKWPKVDYIVGNPPFLGDKFMRRELGDDYVDKLRALYAGRLPGQSDLCCYWFEKARAHIEAGNCKRAGLLATQGIRGGANREVLKRIKQTGDIFWAESDRPWILSGANVHVSMIAFDVGTDKSRMLDGKSVPVINANLTAISDTPTALALASNRNISFQGAVRVGNFDIPYEIALGFLKDANPHGRPNSDVIRPIMNGADLTRRPRNVWAVDFIKRPVDEACLYEAPFSLIERVVKPMRELGKREGRRLRWWQHGETGDAIRTAIEGRDRYLVTPRVAKHRLFVWLSAVTYPDCQLIVFARSDDYFFGVLQSRLHEVWALRMGTRLETRPRYTPTTCFETFPLPTPTAEQESAIAAAAKELNCLRENWLNPPEWTREEGIEFPGTVGGPWDRYIDPATVSDRGAFKVGTVKYPRLVPCDSESAAKLAKRTLTNLYNQRPAWLADAHRKLDEAVFAACGMNDQMTDVAILENLLTINLIRNNPLD